MVKSKFIEIIKTFSPAELKEFRDFIRSPFFNSNKKVIKLFEIVRKYAPQYISPQLLKENLFKKLYPGKNYNDVVMRILISDSMRLGEEFLAYSRFISEPMEEKVLLLKQFSERNLNSLFDSALKRTELKLRSSNISSELYFLDRMFIERQKTEHNIKLDRQKLNGESLRKNGEYLVSFFLISLINIAHDLHVHKDLYNLQSDTNVVDKFMSSFDMQSFMSFLDKSSFKYKNTLGIYYNMLMADLNIENDDYYDGFKKIFTENVNEFSFDEKYDLYLKLESIIIQKIERGNKDYYNDLFGIYVELIKNKIYKTSGDSYMRLEMFRNIFFTAMTVGKINWAEKFISEYINELAPEFRTNMLNQSLAYVNFVKKNFEKSLEYISRVNFNLFVQKADVKIMMLEIYYELKMYEAAYSLMDSFQKFVVKNKNLSGLFKKRYIEFVSVYRLLLNKKSDTVPVSVDEIELKVLNSRRALSKGWLLEKMKEFYK
ncbi:MAG: hypothetical protein L0Y77_04780 [Chlorobi bacterium]|nr:hypothetical protein [Chlorobiota bacterium]